MKKIVILILGFLLPCASVFAQAPAMPSPASNVTATTSPPASPGGQPAAKPNIPPQKRSTPPVATKPKAQIEAKPTAQPIEKETAQPEAKPAVPSKPAYELGASPDGKKDDFDYIKAEIERLLIENKKLESEYEALKHKVDELKARAHEMEREAEVKHTPADEEWAEDRSHQKELNALKAVYGGAEQLRNEIMVKKSRTAYLSTELVDLEEKQRPWKLKLSDLEFLKRELELDIQLLHYELDARAQKQQDAVNKLQEEIQKNLMAERGFLDVIDEVEQGSLNDPQKLMSLFEENETLEIKALNLAHDAEFQDRENDILDKKRILLSQSKGNILNEKQQQKEQLLEEIEQLRGRVDKLHISLDRSLQEKSRREDMLKDFVFLQQENDKLRNQITEIHAQLNETPQ